MEAGNDEAGNDVGIVEIGAPLTQPQSFVVMGKLTSTPRMAFPPIGPPANRQDFTLA